MMQDETVLYKDVLIPKALVDIIFHMKSVENYREELRVLAGQWDLLTILGQISGTGTNMKVTREGFKLLTNELLSQLGLENLKKVSQEINSKAQVAVDIVIRNLFERTADIGFLATDDDIRHYIMNLETLNVMTQEDYAEQNINKTQYRGNLKSQIVNRFNEYTRKYSVYFDIILLDTEGNVLAQMDQNSTLIKSEDPIIQESLNTNEEYVEIFRKTDLLPDNDDSLIYAYRITETNNADSRKLGVLCLCFRFENEMEGVFKNLITANDWSIITLLDKDGKVIASSSELQIPIGSHMQIVTDKPYDIIQFAGRIYLAKTCDTKGYQGFYGLGWRGHVMIPIEHAFTVSATETAIDDQILHAVMEDPKLFSQDLRNIPIQADQIQSELERTVWNGNITGNDTKSKILLWNISDAGAKTKKVFENSIGNLHETVISALLNNVWFWAALSVDIMDRNLYERANDCRWWALTSKFKTILEQEHITPENKKEMSSILQYINNLYTVYTNLFLYDKSRCILAVSNDAETHIVGNTISENWAHETLAIKSSQQYAVSNFDKSDYYNNRNTYIYGASITQTDSNDVLGGIGIVFDSEPEFNAMLHDSLPRNEKGEVLEGCFGAFVQRNGMVISSTCETLLPGNTIDIPSHLLTVENGKGKSEIIQYNGQYYAVGVHASSGYREYKTCDSYKNDVLGFVFVPLAEIKVNTAINKKRDINIDIRSDAKEGDTIEIATFYIGSKWIGMRTNHIIEAVTSDDITFVPGACEFVKGQIMYNDVPTVALDIRSILNEEPKDIDIKSQIIIVKTNKMNIGLIVDGLGEIPEIETSRVEEPDHLIEDTRYTDCIIKPAPKSDDQKMLVVLHPDGLVDCIKDMI